LLAGWVVLTAALIAVGFGVVHSASVAAFDQHVTSVVVAHRTPGLNAVMKATTWLGSWVALTCTAALVVLLAVRGRLAPLAVVLAVVAWAGEAGAVALAKHVVQRSRPPSRIWLKSAHGWSWPSGHAATAALVFSVLAIIAAHFAASRTALVASWAVAIVCVAGVGFSRIELGVHWTTDVLASFAFVSLWILLVAALFSADLRGHRGEEGETSRKRAVPGVDATVAGSEDRSWWRRLVPRTGSRA
jgi:undecaprenyl-diphosphatase